MCFSSHFQIWFVVHLFSGFSVARLNEKHGTDTQLVRTGKGSATIVFVTLSIA